MGIMNNELYNIHTCKIQTESGTYDLELYNIERIEIEETILLPGIVGFIVFRDVQAAFEVGKIQTGDYFHFSWSTSPGRKQFSHKFVIYNIKMLTSKDDDRNFNFVFYFCSEWLIDAFTIQYSKLYENEKLINIIKDILNQCNGINIGYIENSDIKFEVFSTPLWTPIRSIQYILDYYYNSDKKSSHFIFTDISNNKVNIYPLEKLFSGEYSQYENALKPYMTVESNIYHEDRIYNVSIEQDFDLIRYLNTGAISTKFIALHYDENKIIETDIDIVKDLKFEHLSNYLPIKSKYFNKKYMTTKFNKFYPNSEQLVKEDDYKNFINSNLYNRYTKLFADFIKITLLTNPNTNRKVGQRIKVEFPSMAKLKTFMNETFSGNYLIRDVKHIFSDMQYFTALTLITDGYFNNKANNVSW